MRSPPLSCYALSAAWKRDYSTCPQMRFRTANAALTGFVFAKNWTAHLKANGRD